MRMRSRHEKAWPSTSSTGSVSRMIHTMLASRPSRNPSASSRPIRRARPCCRSGRRAARMAMKIRLSMPSTISMTVSVSRLAQVWGSETWTRMSQSMSGGRLPGARVMQAAVGHRGFSVASGLPGARRRPVGSGPPHPRGDPTSRNPVHEHRPPARGARIVAAIWRKRAASSSGPLLAWKITSRRHRPRRPCRCLGPSSWSLPVQADGRHLRQHLAGRRRPQQ